MREMRKRRKGEMSEYDRPRDITGMLASPCVFCGYYGKEYWAANMHAPKCPFYEIAGYLSRTEALVKAADERRLLVLPEVDGSEDGIAEELLNDYRASGECFVRVPPDRVKQADKRMASPRRR